MKRIICMAGGVFLSVLMVGVAVSFAFVGQVPEEGNSPNWRRVEMKPGGNSYQMFVMLYPGTALFADAYKGGSGVYVLTGPAMMKVTQQTGAVGEEYTNEDTARRDWTIRSKVCPFVSFSVVDAAFFATNVFANTGKTICYWVRDPDHSYLYLVGRTALERAYQEGLGWKKGSEFAVVGLALVMAIAILMLAKPRRPHSSQSSRAYGSELAPS